MHKGSDIWHLSKRWGSHYNVRDSDRQHSHLLPRDQWSVTDGEFNGTRLCLRTTGEVVALNNTFRKEVWATGRCDVSGHRHHHAFMHTSHFSDMRYCDWGAPRSWHQVTRMPPPSVTLLKNLTQNVPRRKIRLAQTRHYIMLNVILSSVHTHRFSQHCHTETPTR